jgi:pantetheine-phosphate adenylyltransferase
MKKEHVVIYPGTFDPITIGHLNIIKRALRIFDKVIIAIAEDTTKNTLFTVEERVQMVKESLKGYKNVEVDTFKGLLMEYAKKKGVHTILRGLRTVQDFEYELQMALANKKLNPNCETIFMMTEGAYSYFSSSLIKEIAHLKGNIKDMVPPPVEKMIKKKFFNKEV